jgi:hypothetical protein
LVSRGAQHNKAIHHHDIAVAFFLSTSWARPTAPLRTGDILDRAALGAQAGHDFRSERAVWSQPPPGFAGAMIRRSSMAHAGAAMPDVSARAKRLAKIVRLFMIVSMRFVCHFLVLTRN